MTALTKRVKWKTKSKGKQGNYAIQNRKKISRTKNTCLVQKYQKFKTEIEEKCKLNYKLIKLIASEEVLFRGSCQRENRQVLPSLVD